MHCWILLHLCSSGMIVCILFLSFFLVLFFLALEEVAINLTIELSELTQKWGKRLLESTNTPLCTSGPRRKEQWPHKRLTTTRLLGSRTVQWRCSSVVACHRVGCVGSFEGGHHYLHYLHHSLVSGQTTGREHSPTHRQNIGLKIYWPCPSE